MEIPGPKIKGSKANHSEDPCSIRSWSSESALPLALTSRPMVISAIQWVFSESPEVQEICSTKNTGWWDRTSSAVASLQPSLRFLHQQLHWCFGSLKPRCDSWEKWQENPIQSAHGFAFETICLYPAFSDTFILKKCRDGLHMPSLCHPQWRVYQLKNGKFTTKTWCYNLWLYSFEVICSFHRKPTAWVLYHPKKRQQTSLGKPHKWMAIGKQTRFAYILSCMVLVGMWGRCSPSSQTQVYSPINHTLMGLEFSHSHPIPSLVMDPANVWKSSTDEAANAKKNIKTAMYWKINPYKSQFSQKKSGCRDGAFSSAFLCFPASSGASPASFRPSKGVEIPGAFHSDHHERKKGPQRATSIFCSYGSSKNSHKGINSIWLVVDLPLWKMMEFVNGKDDIPCIMENKSHLWNHQPAIKYE